jgi:hypothetical protein
MHLIETPIEGRFLLDLDKFFRKPAGKASWDLATVTGDVDVTEPVLIHILEGMQNMPHIHHVHIVD